MNRGAWWVTVHGSQRVWHDWVTDTYLCDGIESMNSHIGTDTAQQPMPDTGTKVYMTLPVHEQRSTPAWHFSSVQFSSVAQSCQTLCDPMNHSAPGLLVPHQLPEFTQTYVHRVSDIIQPSHPLSSPSPLAPIPPSIRVFSNESTLHMRWPKYWSFSFSISPFNEHPGLISFRMEWLDLLAVQGTLKSLLQHHSSKA